MLTFPNAKINIGLNVIEKRNDGYHNIESIFYPIEWCDTLEVMPHFGSGEIQLHFSGIPIQVKVESNLVYKAYTLLHEKHNLPSVNAWLLKTLPMGAGIGGGSADGAYMLHLLNNLFALGLSKTELRSYAEQLGSDCPFFIENKPVFVSGKGENMKSIPLNLTAYYIAIVHPGVHVETKNAYSLIIPHKSAGYLPDIVLTSPIAHWKNHLINDFEAPIFKLHPELAEIKKTLYKLGALYASMTGSGSAIYGIFDKEPIIATLFPACKTFVQQPKIQL
jgi:4-diphosphocytidyl-2-C-methyl-D-erythritol kinase